MLVKSYNRGHFNHGWLETYHTFSFGGFLNRNQMGFRSLRVINEDRVLAGSGFGTHPHNDMEIITYMLDGELHHKDSMGNDGVISAGEVQVMTAGSGITHSEFNASESKDNHLLQIWIKPREKGLRPDYDQKLFLDDEKRNRLCLIAAPDNENALHINTDAYVYVSELDFEEKITFEGKKGRGIWIQLIEGKLDINGETLEQGDGIGLEDSNADIEALEDAHFLLFDLG